MIWWYKCNFYPAHCTVAWHAISGLSSLLFLSIIQMILKPNRSAKLPGPRALTSQLGSVLVSIMVPVMMSSIMGSVMRSIWCRSRGPLCRGCGVGTTGVGHGFVPKSVVELVRRSIIGLVMGPVIRSVMWSNVSKVSSLKIHSLCQNSKVAP